MCGILGSINILIDEQLLATIKHRGPDDYGIESVFLNNCRVTLAQRRLSIVDLSPAGHQPMISDCGNYMITFNGEIYNHAELKKALPDSINFQGHSDTETILYYIRHFGIQAIKDFNGIFALAFLDIQNKTLYLSRDRFGVKPLYYYFKDNSFLFASELRPIRNVCNPESDLGALGNCLAIRYFPSPMTPFKLVYKLEPGQLISIGLINGQVTLDKTSFIKKEPSLGSYKATQSALIKTYGDLFIKAVDRQLMADVDIGILLSGGIDSALMAAVAQQRTDKRLKAFTIGFVGTHSGIDETAYAAETARLLGLEHFCEQCDFQDFLGSIKKVVEITEEPLGTTSIIPMYFLSRLASSKVKVVLSGQGADEPLGGYRKYRYLPILAEIRKTKFLLDSLTYLSPWLQRKERARRFTSAICAKDIATCYIEYNSISSYEAVFETFNQIDLVSEKRQQFFQLIENRLPFNSNIKDLFPYLDLRTSLADDLLMYTDKITMHFGLECRVPILDNDLIEFVESLHSSLKYNTWNGKLIHKSFAKEFLPSKVINRPKMGFNSPTETWFKENNEQILEILNSNPTFIELFSMQKVNELVRSHSMAGNVEKHIFLLLALNYFLDQVGDPEELQNSQFLHS